MLRRARARLQQRWDARASTPGHKASATASCEIDRLTPADVWAFVRPAEVSARLDPDVVRAFTVPGTGPGVGEQQCFVRRTTIGREVVQTLLVTAEVPEHFAETIMQGSRAGSRFEVQATDGGTTYTVTMWCELAPGQHQRVYGRAEDELRHSVNEHVRGVKELLESGALPD